MKFYLNYSKTEKCKEVCEHKPVTDSTMFRVHYVYLTEFNIFCLSRDKVPYLIETQECYVTINLRNLKILAKRRNQGASLKKYCT